MSPIEQLPHIPMRRLVLAGVLSSLSLAALFAFVAWQMANKDYDRARQGASNVLTSMAQDIARSLEIYSLSIEAVVDSYPDDQVSALDDRIKRLVLFDRAATQSDLGSIFVADQSGNLTLESRPGTIREKQHWGREYFRIHYLQPHFGLYVSRPWTTPQGEQWLALSRRIESKTGEFLGVVVGTIRLNYFRNLFQAIPREQGQSLAISYDDGTILMRVPYDEKLIGRNLKDSTGINSIPLAMSGNFDSTSTHDKVDRSYAFQRVGSYPLILTYGISFDEIYRHWRWQTVLLGLVLIVLCAANIGLLLMLGQELKKRSAAEKRLATFASEDVVTGLANRRVFEDALCKLWARACLEQKPIAAIMADADHFKQFNDRHGHLIGDLALRTIANCIAESVRATDIAARYGGEEFVIVMPDATLEQAKEIALRIRESLLRERSKFQAAAETIPTVSMGVAAIVPHGDVSDILLKRADSALYEAKKLGRNRIQIFSPGSKVSHAAA